MNTSFQSPTVEAGALSQADALVLSAAFLQIGSILTKAGVVDQKTLASLQSNAEVLTQPKVTATQTERTAETPPLPEPKPEKNDDVQAVRLEAEAKFKEQVQRQTWPRRLGDTLRIFAQRFQMLHHVEGQALEDTLKGYDATDRDGAIGNLLSDLMDVLMDLSKDHPGPMERDGYPTYSMPYYDDYYMGLSRGDKAKQEATTVAASSAVSLLAIDPNEVRVQVEFDCTPQSLSASASESNVSMNRRPVEGVLFRINEPSEHSPSVGPRLPLYIPSEVAASVVDTVSGLPLDAADSLSGHANEEIAGVMLSAEILGNDFIVRGYLWPWSQQQKVANISAHRDRLGMSMNATAVGHEAEVDGIKVFWIDSLELLGANILFADKATYQQTRLVAADAAQDDVSNSEQETEAVELTAPTWPAGAIAASAQADPEPSYSDEEIMDIEAIKTQLDEISTGLKSLTHLSNDVETLKNQMSEIQAERTEQEAQIQAAVTQQQFEQQQQNLAKLIAETLDQKLEQKINPSGQPPRKTVSLAAQAEMKTEETEIAVAQSELQKIEAQLDILRQTNSSDGTVRLQLAQRVRDLKMQLGIA